MKKLFLVLTTIGAMYAYNAFADKTPIGSGCEEADFFECQVWQVTPNGSGMILERGYNSISIVD